MVVTSSLLLGLPASTADSSIVVTISGIQSGATISDPTNVQVNAIAPAQTPITDFDVNIAGNSQGLWWQNPIQGWRKFVGSSAICGPISSTNISNGLVKYSSSCELIPSTQIGTTQPQIEGVAYLSDHSRFVSAPVSITEANQAKYMWADLWCAHEAPLLSGDLAADLGSLSTVEGQILAMQTTADAQLILSSLQALQETFVHLDQEMSILGQSSTYVGLENSGTACINTGGLAKASSARVGLEPIQSRLTQDISDVKAFINDPLAQKNAQENAACTTFVSNNSNAWQQDIDTVQKLEEKIPSLVTKSDATKLLTTFSKYSQTLVADLTALSKIKSTDESCLSDITANQGDLQVAQATLKGHTAFVTKFANSPSLQKAALLAKQDRDAQFAKQKQASAKIATARAKVAAAQAQADAVFEFNRGYKELFNTTEYGLEVAGFYNFLNGAGVMTSTNGYSWCVAIARRGAAGASYNIDAWVQGCAKAAVKIKHH